MNCNSFEAFIALYAEGDLDSSRAKSVESHLKSCASCQRFLIELEASQAMVKELAAESLDPASFNVVRQRVMREVNRRKAARPLWCRFLSPGITRWRPAWGAALAVLVMLGFLFEWQLWRKPAGSARPDASKVGSASTVRKDNPEASSPDLPETMTPKPEPSAELATQQFAKRHKTPEPRDFLLPTGVQSDAVAAESESPVEQGSNLQPEEPLPADIAPEPPPPLVIKLVTDDPNIVIVWLVDQDVQHN